MGELLGRGRGAVRRLGARLVQADLDALEQRLVREVVALGVRLDGEDDRLRHGTHEVQLVATSLLSRVERLEAALEELGAAMSREHGLAGAAAAYRETVYLVHELRRDLRGHTAASPGSAPAAASPGTPAAGSGTPAPTDPYAGKHPRRFDYAGFERRFRGDPASVGAALAARYLPLLEGTEAVGRGPLVDIGCGRGELLEVLHGRGWDVVGVEPEPALAAQTRERGVPVVEALGADHLRGLEDGSLGAVVSFHVVEHLVVDDLLELLELSARKLRPGGLFVAETPNPMTFLTLHESYLLDPTHVQPLHPALLSWLAESSGFRSVEVQYHSPATSLHVPPLGDLDPTEGRLDEAFARLNHQLYGPQDYSLVARR